jgi:hypothetical protein
MSSVSKSIFVLEGKSSEFLYDYISLVFTDVYAYRVKKNSLSMSTLFCCFCCENSYDSVISYANTRSDTKVDKFTKWIIDFSIRYLNMSHIKTDNLLTHTIECIDSTKVDKILIQNSNKATVIYHFNDKTSGYITTHESSINFLSSDQKYIVVTFR